MLLFERVLLYSAAILLIGALITRKVAVVFFVQAAVFEFLQLLNVRLSFFRVHAHYFGKVEVKARSFLHFTVAELDIFFRVTRSFPIGNTPSDFTSLNRLGSVIVI